jgi:hypothetical protein
MDIDVLMLTPEQINITSQLAMLFETELTIRVRITRNALNVAALLNAAMINHDKIANERKRFIATLSPHQQSILISLGTQLKSDSQQTPPPPEPAQEKSSYKFGARSL